MHNMETQERKFYNSVKKGIGTRIDHKLTQNNKSEHTAGPSGPGGPSISMPCESENGKIEKLKTEIIYFEET